MKLKNPFPIEVKELYAFEHCCHQCGSNEGLEWHHILGRVSNSVLNCMFLCHKCHVDYTKFDKRELLKKQLKWLILYTNYKWRDEDYKFYNENIRYYERARHTKTD